MEIRKQLKYGDQKMIANVVGCSAELVKKVMSGERNHQKKKGKEIVRVAKRIIETRIVILKLGE